MKNTETKDFIAYEYLSINIPSDKEPLYLDIYENFGWILINNLSSSGLVDKEDYYINNSNVNGKKLINLKFKRDRKIPNKAKIINLQAKCEKSLKELNYLEKEPYKKGAFYTTINALLGTIFVAISTFLVTSNTPNYILMAITGIIGITIWCLSYFIYNKIKNKYEKINVSLIENTYNNIYNACEQSKKLLNE